MLKLRKIFSLGMVVTAVAALGLMVSSCVEPKDTYSVTMYDGGTGATGAGSSYEEGETVTIYAGTKAGKVFDQWTVDEESKVLLANPKNATTTFTMPAKNVAVRANWLDEGGDTYTAVIYPNIYNPTKVITKHAEEGDTIRIDAEGVFLSWWISDDDDEDVVGIVGNEFSRSTYFIMPAFDITVMALPTDVSWVRYTWEKAQEPNIQSISASYHDVEEWFETWFSSADYVEEDATDIPMYFGVPVIVDEDGDSTVQVPNNIFSRTLHAASGSPYKSKYFPIEIDPDEDDAGKFTAVCTVDDFQYDNIVDIVANYNINFVGDKAWFEVAFDVGTLLADEGSPWFDDKFGDSTFGPRLEKPKVKKLTKKLANGSVTYYILHRARK